MRSAAFLVFLVLLAGCEKPHSKGHYNYSDWEFWAFWPPDMVPHPHPPSPPPKQPQDDWA